MQLKSQCWMKDLTTSVEYIHTGYADNIDSLEVTKDLMAEKYFQQTNILNMFHRPRVHFIMRR